MFKFNIKHIKHKIMKRIITLFLITFLTISINGQIISDSAILGPGYANDVYFSLENSTVATPSQTDWTVSFATSMFSVAIFTNDGKGVELFLSAEDPADFATLDTAGMDYSDVKYNTYDTWTNGAFSKGTASYGWGEYNPVTHVVTGTQLFVLKTLAGDFYKVHVEKKQMGEWHFRYATIDNSFDSTFVFTASDYVDRNFVYIDMDAHTLTNDREPLSANWDLLFRKYMGIIMGTPYSVTGVLVNDGLEVAQVDGVNTNTSTHVGESFSDNISEIGSDWKSFNMGTFSYDIVGDRTYFVKKESTITDYTIKNYYKIVFTDFVGSSAGKAFFTREMVAIDSTFTGEIPEDTTEINDLENINIVSVYPNPSSSIANVVLDSKTNISYNISIVNTLGQVVYFENTEVNGFVVKQIDVANFKNGLYFIQIESGGKTQMLKLQVK